MTNPYITSPLYIAQVNPSSGRYVRAFFFLGTVPKAVLAAAKRGRPRGSDPRQLEWTPADGSVLRSHYGQHWRDLLTAEDPPASDTGGLASRQTVSFFGSDAGSDPLEIVGGATLDDEDVGGLNFGDLKLLDNVEEQGSVTSTQRSTAAIEWPALIPSPPVFLDIAVYPEDTVRDLMLKLTAASGVPTYRQHLFYYVNEEGPTIPYRATVDGAPIVVNWRSLARAGPVAFEAKLAPGKKAPKDRARTKWQHQNSHSTTVAGLSIDPRHEGRREGIRIEARDVFTTLSPVPGVRVTRAYYADLFTVLPPLGAPERPHDGLASVLKDSYQFDLLYFGALLLYWPQLSLDAASLALTEPDRLSTIYPTLEPDPAALRSRFATEREVADLAASWRGGTQSRSTRAMTAVTAATVRVRPDTARMRVAVRNVFDWVRTTPVMPAIVARFDVESTLFETAVFETAALADMRGGRVPVLTTKRHVSSFGPRSATTVDWFTGRLPRRDSVAFAIARSDSRQDAPCVGALCRVPYAFMTAYADGRYDVSADWREDDRVSFEAIATEISSTVSPLVAEINAMGAAAFPIGGSLPMPLGRNNSKDDSATTKSVGGTLSLGGITVSAFWPHALPTASFRELKNRFRRYEKAGIVTVRGLQQAGAYTFSFRKGIIAYDSRLVGGMSFQNQFSWLTDAAAAAHWSSVFHGRTVRIFHRSTDLRVEILAADNLAEFELIRRYVFSFLDSLLVGGDRLRTVDDTLSKAAPRKFPEQGALSNTHQQLGPATQRLRRLQERDPNLFDLKKYGPDATVYSVLCQSGRQPSIYNTSEAARLPAKRRDALVRYWNFTENAPAFYECADPRYPYLSFRAGQHPLGYFLPCCKMTRAPPGSRAALANEQAAQLRNGPLETRSATTTAEDAATSITELDNDVDASTSRHVLTYGKAIPPGRIADVPREVSEGLFLDAMPEPYKLLLVGVEQTAPGVTDAGFAYSIAYIAGEGDTSADDVLRDLANAAASMGDTYYALGGGAGARFESAGALSDAILGAFVRRDLDFSIFGPGGELANEWPEILAELVRYTYGIEIVRLVDADGTGSVSLEATASAAQELLGTPHVHVALVAVGPNGTYPLAALDPKFFLRAPLSQRWMAARRTFGGEPRDSAQIVDQVAAVVRRVLEWRSPLGWQLPLEQKEGSTENKRSSYTQAPNMPPTLDLIRRFASASAIKIELYLANMCGLCYGVIISTPEGKSYLPVQYSIYPLDGDTPIEFGPRPEISLPLSGLEYAINALNNHIRKAAEPFATIGQNAVTNIIDADGQVIGFCEMVSGVPLYYFHDVSRQGAKVVLGATPRSGKDILFPYSSRDIDAAIKSYLSSTPEPNEDGARVKDLASTALARNRLYRLFLAEFSATLRADKNTKVRAALAEAIVNTKFDSAASMATLRGQLSGLLGGHPEDLLAVRDVVVRALEDGSDPKKTIIRSLDSSSFAFDRKTLVRLKSLRSHDEVVSALRTLMAPRITVTPLGSNPVAHQPSHIFVSCSETSSVPSEQCSGRRLVVPAERIDDFYDILAADVRNPGKEGLLSALSAGVFDPLDFQRRPDEHLTVVLGAR